MHFLFCHSCRKEVQQRFCGDCGNKSVELERSSPARIASAEPSARTVWRRDEEDVSEEAIFSRAAKVSQEEAINSYIASQTMQKIGHPSASSGSRRGPSTKKPTLRAAKAFADINEANSIRTGLVKDDNFNREATTQRNVSLYGADPYTSNCVSVDAEIYIIGNGNKNKDIIFTHALLREQLEFRIGHRILDLSSFIFQTVRDSEAWKTYSKIEDKKWELAESSQAWIGFKVGRNLPTRMISTVPEGGLTIEQLKRDINMKMGKKGKACLCVPATVKSVEEEQDMELDDSSRTQFTRSDSTPPPIVRRKGTRGRPKARKMQEQEPKSIAANVIVLEDSDDDDPFADGYVPKRRSARSPIVIKSSAVTTPVKLEDPSSFIPSSSVNSPVNVIDEDSQAPLIYEQDLPFYGLSPQQAAKRFGKMTSRSIEELNNTLEAYHNQGGRSGQRTTADKLVEQHRAENAEVDRILAKIHRLQSSPFFDAPPIDASAMDPVTLQQQYEILRQEFDIQSQRRCIAFKDLAREIALDSNRFYELGKMPPSYPSAVSLSTDEIVNICRDMCGQREQRQQKARADREKLIRDGRLSTDAEDTQSGSSVGVGEIQEPSDSELPVAIHEQDLRSDSRTDIDNKKQQARTTKKTLNTSPDKSLTRSKKGARLRDSSPGVEGVQTRSKLRKRGA